MPAPRNRNSNRSEEIDDDPFSDEPDDELDEGDDDSDDDSDDGPIETGDEIDAPEPRQSRREKRRDRMVELAAERARERLEGAMNAQLSEIRGMLQGAMGGRQGQGEPAPRQGGLSIEKIDEALAKKYGEIDTVSTAWSAKIASGSMTEDERKELLKKSRVLSEEVNELVAVKTAVKMGLGPQRQQDPAEMQNAIIRQQTRSRHNDIFSHKNEKALVTFADGYYMQRRAKGVPDSQELQDEAMDAARAEFGLPTRHRQGKPPPDKATKSRLSNASGGGGGGSRSSGGGNTLKVTKEVRQMAAIAMPHIKDETKRLREYAKLLKSKGEL